MLSQTVSRSCVRGLNENIKRLNVDDHFYMKANTFKIELTFNVISLFAELEIITGVFVNFLFVDLPLHSERILFCSKNQHIIFR